MSSSNQRPPWQAKPAPLPAEITDWDRKVKHGLTLNDHVEVVHLKLWESDKDEGQQYRAFLEAVWDSDAVEGSLAIDNTMAAILLRDEAKKIPGNPVGGKNLNTIKMCMNVVLRRYGNSRNERRHTVHGQRVPSDDGNNVIE